MKFHFAASKHDQPQKALKDMSARYGQTAIDNADVIVALGGDGFLLETIRENLDRQIPIYGMNLGTRGFLMNPYSEDDLEKQVTYAQSQRIHPLKMEATLTDGSQKEALAFNEVALNRDSPQAAKIDIKVDGKETLDDHLVGDGILISTTMGSTAYNLAAGGPILPMGSNLLALTPICAAEPLRWPGAILQNTSKVGFDIIDSYKRPVTVSADVVQFHNAEHVTVYEDLSHEAILLYEPNHHLSDKIMRAQFKP